MELNELAKRASKFVVGTEGNVSERSHDSVLCRSSCLIKKSGTRLEDCDFVWSNDPEASIEASFHEAIYKETSCQFICHTHPINLLKLLCSNQIEYFASVRLFPDQVVFNPSYCVVPYAHPGEELTREILKSAAKSKEVSGIFPSIFLLRNHGLITCGTASQCIIATEICEKAAAIYNDICSTGSNFSFLIQDQIQAIKDDCKEKKRGNIC